ncbi:MAG: TRAP transporter small permease [Oscillospiraceae bacterium]|nr:TRAP transporter small permease [Oscillospiraceae bacterium]
MKKILYLILDFLCFIAENLSVIGGIGLIAMMVITATDVILRMFSSSVLGSMELISYLMCVVIFLSFGKATFVDSFTKVELFDFKKAEPLIRALMDIIHAVMCAFASYYCFVQSGVTKSIGTVSQMLKIPRWPFLVLSGTGFLLITISIPLSKYKKHKMKEKSRSAEIGEGTA